MSEGAMLESGEPRHNLISLVDSAEVEFVSNGVPVRFSTAYVAGHEQERPMRNFIDAQALDDNSSVVVKFKDGTTKTITKTEEMIDITEADELTIDGKAYKYGKDVWQNPNLVALPLRKESTAEFDTVLKKVIGLWESALAGDEAFDHFLAENIDKEELAEIQSGIDYLRSHPLLQRAYFDWQKVNPWNLAQLKTTDERRQALKKSWVASSLVDGEEFINLNNIANKISEGVELDAQDNAFLAALNIKDRANSLCIHQPLDIYLTDINRRYAIANIIEGYLTRAVVPGGVFQEHEGHYRQFGQTLRDHGVEVPEWFTPFLGDEFIYGIRINGIIANLGGKYFIDSRTGEKGYMARIFDHERVHALEKEARSQASHVVKEGEKEFMSEEGYTETLALLIKNNGSVETALQENNNSGLWYANAVRELLGIIGEINNVSTDQFLGVTLLARGLFELPKRNWDSSPLSLIKQYYDENDIGRGKTFEEKMKPYSDSRFYSSHEEFTEDQNLPSDRIVALAREISFESVRALYPYVDENLWNTLVKGVEKWPFGLLGTSMMGSARDLILEAVLKDQEAKSELQAITDSFYRNYIVEIKKRYEIV